MSEFYCYNILKCNIFHKICVMLHYINRGGNKMGYESFKELEKDYSELYISEKYIEALNLLEKGSESLPKEEIEKNFFIIMLDKANFYKKCNLDEKCIDTLEYLIHNQFVCPLYRRVFEPLSQSLRFAKLKKKNDLLRKQAREKATFQYKVYLPEGYTEDKKYPVFFNLHGDCENMNFHHDYWGPEVFLKKEFIVVYPQSSQLIFHESYAWLKYALDVKGDEPWLDSPNVYRLSETSCYMKESYDKAHSEIKACYEQVSEQYSINKECIIFGGFSSGASTSVEITMANIIPIKGFISLCPDDKPKIFSKAKVEEAIERGVKGVFMEGEQSLPVPDEDDMMKVFDEAGFQYEYYINKGVGHWYSEGLDGKLERALEFILG